MTLPDGYVYGEVRGGLGRWCVCRPGGDRMLCGQRMLQVPALEFQPFPDPSEVHRECLAALVRLTAPAPAPVPLGVCPACGERVELVAGLIGPHNLCVGVNMAPKRGRR